MVIQLYFKGIVMVILVVATMVVVIQINNFISDGVQF